ncbi:MAG: glycosyltransferase [Prevotella sp.]|uniref:glycosyltransferase n=1 Tax=unclassified Dysgonomonas TaxID=2630389 RepID=UPI0025BE2B04|nr:MULTISPECIES: glycosyltransferase [unclassified Dysgonomonas]MDR1714363.1 glycosyltransferase [Prevotella sp.]MDR2002829.1 glycosyltransferase [Prevotella sp.]HMM03428.1 glycosyltransferase [Dysgonomonas sp.]
MIEQILHYFMFNELEIAGIAFFSLLFLIQIFFYFNYYRKPYSVACKREKNSNKPFCRKPKVSVIIASENAADELAENLPVILTQDYPDFEVIVVNNGSTDESETLLQSLQLKHPHLYITYLPYSNDITFGRRKLALTIGIKAAKGEVLLFTEPYSKPVSDQWISSMMEELPDGKDVVLGYSFYSRTKTFFNRIARFDNHLFSMQYISMALKSRPFTGIYRNLAFRKHLFFDNKGFAAFLNLENGEDVFINQIITDTNTSVALSSDSFMESSNDRFSLWKQVKKSYSITKKYFKRKTPINLFALEAATRYLFYLMLVALVVYSAIFFHWTLLGITVFLFMFRLVVQLIIINKSTQYFRSGKFHSSLILMDFLQPFYNFRFKTSHKNRATGRR